MIKRMRVLFVVAMMLNISACVSMVVGGVADGGSRDSRSSAQQQRDADITNRINSAYVKDKNIPSLSIRVRCDNGIVTLSGTVPSQDVRSRAVRVAEQTAGVVSVRNYLGVR